MSHINGHEVVYHIDEKNGVVIASISGIRDDAWNVLAPFQEKLPCVGWTAGMMIRPDSISAKARCSKDDTFDVEIGKYIARKRLRFKYWKKYGKALSRMEEEFEVASKILVGETIKAFLKAMDNLTDDIEQKEA